MAVHERSAAHATTAQMAAETPAPTGGRTFFLDQTPHSTPTTGTPHHPAMSVAPMKQAVRTAHAVGAATVSRRELGGASSWSRPQGQHRLNVRLRQFARVMREANGIQRAREPEGQPIGVVSADRIP